MELAGSLGDLGTLLPITIGMVMVNGMSAVGTFYTIGLFYLLAGYYFRVPIAVQPMKAIGAYAIGTAMSPEQICGATLLVSVILGIIGVTGTIATIGRIIPKAVIRGVQLSTGVLLLSQGLKLIYGTSTHQLQTGMNEPFFVQQYLGPIPLGPVIGCIGIITTLFLLNNRKYPAALVVLAFGVICGLLLSDLNTSFGNFAAGFYLPSILPYNFPEFPDFTVALFVLVLPQIPMTIGNATIASADLSHEYFREASAKVTYKSLTISMVLASGVSFLFGGIPLCHGAGGLAAHYRFGARTSGSNLIIGSFFLGLAIFFGPHAITLLHLIPFSILGVLLIFAGAQLGLAILDMMDRKNMFIVLIMLTITLTSSLAWSFVAGVIIARILRSPRVSV